jgi:hypothetical protein
MRAMLPDRASPRIQTPSSVTSSDRAYSAADRKRRRHKVARRLYEALVAQDPNRAITLCDEAGNVLARHDRLPEHQCSKDLHFMDWRLGSAYVPRGDRCEFL